MYKKGFTRQIMSPRGHYQKERTGSYWCNERWIRWKNHERNYRIKSKTYSYLTDNNDKNKKAKNTEKCVIKRKLKFEGYKILTQSQYKLNLEATQLKNK